MTTDREQFEAWAIIHLEHIAHDLVLDETWGGTYANKEVEAAWKAWSWQAARAAPAHTHRWNIDPQDDGSLLICEGEHEKNEACTYVRWTRAAPAQQDRPSTPIGWSDSDWIKHLQSLRIPSELLLLANDPLMGQALLRLIERAAPAQPAGERPD
jgi:hypothetical protein